LEISEDRSQTKEDRFPGLGRNRSKDWKILASTFQGLEKSEGFLPDIGKNTLPPAGEAEGRAAIAANFSEGGGQREALGFRCVALGRS
jgi:hypothetical protein